MKTRGLGLLGIVTSLVAGCSLEWPAPGRGAGGATPGISNVEDKPGWSIPGHETSGGTGAGGSSSGGTSSGSSGAGGSDLGGPTCSWGLPTTVQIPLPGWRTLASAPLARALTNAKKLPDPARVGPSDFLNYYQVKYPDPPVDTDVGLYAGVLDGDLATELVMQIALQAPAKYERPPIALAVVVDTSLSMAGEPWKRAKAAVAALASALQPGDTFTLVTAKRAKSSASDASEAAALADGLVLDAGEDLGGALDDAYQAVSEAQAGDDVERLGRVVLISDGAAQATSIHLDTVATNAQQGVPLIGVGVGEAESYDGYFLQTATANGAGANLYLDGVAEADALLRARFDELMITIGSEIHIEVNLPESLRVQPSPTPAQVGSPTGASTASLNAGRTLVMRSVLETCDVSSANAAGLSITASVRYRPAGSASAIDGPSTQTWIGDHQYKPQMLKAGAIAAYAEALANVRAPLLEKAATLSQKARNSDLALADDPALLEIEALIQSDLEIIKAAVP